LPSVKLDHAVTVSMEYVQKSVVNCSFMTFEIPIFTIQPSRE
jgi:hypothetical protein